MAGLWWQRRGNLGRRIDLTNPKLLPVILGTKPPPRGAGPFAEVAMRAILVGNPVTEGQFTLCEVVPDFETGA